MNIQNGHLWLNIISTCELCRRNTKHVMSSSTDVILLLIVLIIGEIFWILTKLRSGLMNVYIKCRQVAPFQFHNKPDQLNIIVCHCLIKEIKQQSFYADNLIADYLKCIARYCFWFLSTILQRACLWQFGWTVSVRIRAPSNKFAKEISQSSFGWYQQVESGKWHCTICRRDKIDGAYSRGHDTPAKTTDHARHAKHSFVCNKYEIVEKGHENRAKKKKNRNMQTTGIR